MTWLSVYMGGLGIFVSMYTNKHIFKMMIMMIIIIIRPQLYYYLVNLLYF